MQEPCPEPTGLHNAFCCIAGALYHRHAAVGMHAHTNALTARLVVVVTLEALISRFRLADHRVAMGSPAKELAHKAATHL